MDSDHIVSKLNQLCKNSFVDHLGIQFTNSAENTLEAYIELKPHHFQPKGFVHGGVYMAFAETLAGAGSALIAEAEGKLALGASINSQHIAPAKGGMILGKATLTYQGITKHVWDVEISDENGKLISLSRVNNSIKEFSQIQS